VTITQANTRKALGERPTEKFIGQITPQTNNINPDIMIQTPKMMSAQMHGPVTIQLSAQDRDLSSN
jgi:hypothetical protein